MDSETAGRESKKEKRDALLEEESDWMRQEHHKEFIKTKTLKGKEKEGETARRKESKEREPGREGAKVRT